MTSTTSQNNKEAVNLLLSVLSKQFGVEICEDDYDSQVYSCSIAPEYQNVYFIKLNNSSYFSNLCMLARNRQKTHRGPSSRSYCVNIKTNKVISMCFSSKCKKRGGGKYIFQDVDSDTSSEDESSEDEKNKTSKKLKV